mmetsp:Transcript_99406/g.207079  ORF Transcript_99406/g.207079 Transcript_99406/m.207079 type:complete len:359 (-) Transcript_99406:496-1572(-)
MVPVSPSNEHAARVRAHRGQGQQWPTVKHHARAELRELQVAPGRAGDLNSDDLRVGRALQHLASGGPAALPGVSRREHVGSSAILRRLHFDARHLHSPLDHGQPRRPDCDQRRSPSFVRTSLAARFLGASDLRTLRLLAGPGLPFPNSHRGQWRREVHLPPNTCRNGCASPNWLLPSCQGSHDPHRVIAFHTHREQRRHLLFGIQLPGRDAGSRPHPPRHPPRVSCSHRRAGSGDGPCRRSCHMLGHMREVGGAADVHLVRYSFLRNLPVAAVLPGMAKHACSSSRKPARRARQKWAEAVCGASRDGPEIFAESAQYSLRSCCGKRGTAPPRSARTCGRDGEAGGCRTVPRLLLSPTV